MSQQSSLEKLEKLRKDVDDIDIEIVNLFAKRREITLNIGKIKKKTGIPLYDKKIEDERINTAVKHAKKITTDINFHELVEATIKATIQHCRNFQFAIIGNKHR